MYQGLLLLLLLALFGSGRVTAEDHTVDFEAEITLLGVATLSQESLTLTEDLQDQKGAAWFTQPIKLATFSGAPLSWGTYFTFLITSSSSSDFAEGLSFIVSQDIGISPLDAGSSLGYEGLLSSLAIEFDTSQSDAFPDPEANHIGINLDGSMESMVTEHLSEDLKGTVHHCWVDYKGGTFKTLDVFLSTSPVKPSTAVLSLNVDVAALVGSTGFFGFSAATGGASEAHQILSWSITNPFLHTCHNGISWGSVPCTCIEPVFLLNDCDLADLCSVFDCQPMGACPPGGQFPLCDCAENFFSSGQCNREDPCYNNPCQNGGQCLTYEDYTFCDCWPTGYDGQFCEIPRSPCEFYPCYNGQCVDQGDGSYSCDCSYTPFTGTYCEEMRPCETITCQNGGQCYNYGDGTEYCDCSWTGYDGEFCQGSDPCLNSPCQNGGQCVNLGDGTSSCDCTGTGFDGALCENNINDCPAENPCQNGGQCVDGLNSYTCDCAETGFDGALCEHNIDDCPAENPCQHGGQCVDGLSSFSCDCTGTGFDGELCEYNINDCPAENPCQNGGQCVDGIKSFSCDCANTGFDGEFCENDINDCPAKNPCQNGGQCVDGIKSFSCDCTGTGFYGSRCTMTVNCTATSLTEGNAAWAKTSTPAGGYAWGVCLPGFVGKPYRVCQKDGSFGPITSPCTPVVDCPADTYSNAHWPITQATQTSVGSCLPGYGGSPRRKCNQDGTWATFVTDHCVRLNCSSIQQGSASWPETRPNSKAVGVCSPGMIGRPTRLCSDQSQWLAISNPCQPQRVCPSQNYARASWEATAPGVTATGSCIAGWTGAPLRICKPDGSWQDYVKDHCIRI